MAAGSPSNAIVVDAAGSVYLTGHSSGGVPSTPGAYRTTCDCAPVSTGFFSVPLIAGYVARFDPAASKLIYATYLDRPAQVPGASLRSAIALSPDGSAYISGPLGVYRLNATGSSLLASFSPPITIQTLALAPDGSLYVAGAPYINQFQPTSGAFQTTPSPSPNLPSQGTGSASALLRLDAQLHTVLAGSYFGGAYGNSIEALTFDSSGNLYLGGYTSPRDLPTVTPFVQGFGTAAGTGYLARLSADLSTLLFSSYFGDNEYFGVTGVAIGANGNVLIGGSTGSPNQLPPMNIWVNSLALAPPPALRVDAVLNAASHLSDPVSPGETIRIRGSGFGSDAQLTIGGVPVKPVSISPSEILAIAPQRLPDAANVQVLSGGAASNELLVAVAPASPGLFAAGGNGTGQGYILNSDGTFNTPANPATLGDRITIYATGVGPVSFAGGYAVTQYPVSVFVDGFYCNGVSAVMGAVDGFPGDVYQLTVTVPDLATLVANNPDLKNFRFPPLAGVILRINGVSSQNGLAISLAN